MGRFDTSGVLGIRNQRGDHLVQWIAIGCGVHNCHVMTMIRRATVMGDPSIGRSIARRSKQPRVLLLQHADSTVPKLVGEGVNSRTTQPLKAPPSGPDRSEHLLCWENRGFYALRAKRPILNTDPVNILPS